MANTHEFLKLGNRVIVKPAGSDYSLIAGKTYDLIYDRFEGTQLLENGELNLPKKVYKSNKDITFIKRVTNYYNNSTDNTVGVMLAGIKGTGKTIMAKELAKESGLPIIIVSPSFPERELTRYFKKFTQEVCILLDEVEKNYDTENMLGFLDGVEKTCRKLVIMTCNSLREVSEYMQDRCSRIRYLRKYTAEANREFVPMIVKDLEIKNPDKVVEFINNEFKLLSMDNIFSFLREVKLSENTTENYGEIISILNVETKTNFTLNGELEDNSTETVDEPAEKKKVIVNHIDDYEDGRDDYANDIVDEPDDYYDAA